MFKVTLVFFALTLSVGVYGQETQNPQDLQDLKNSVGTPNQNTAPDLGNSVTTGGADLDTPETLPPDKNNSATPRVIEPQENP